ncbi:MAG: hypothetical protein ACI81S_001651 [Sphingobacteriales bacterium]|jgi:hypothetical protein
MKALKFILPVVIIILAVLLYRSIADPIQFQKKKTYVESYVIQKLKDIRSAQVAYKNVNGKYTGDFNVLIDFIKTDSLPVVTKLGDPDDSTSVVTIDTSYVSVLDSLFGMDYPIDSLSFVPFSSKNFAIEVGEISKGGVVIPVFQVRDTDPIDRKRILQVGSLTEASNAGNWE